MTPRPIGGENGGNVGSPGLRWITARLAPPILVAVMLAVSLAGAELARNDLYGLVATGFGFLVFAAVLWWWRMRYPRQETLAGATRLATIVAVMVVLGIIVAVRSG